MRKLVDRFYDLMSELPDAAHVLRMHPQDLKGSRDKFFDFLSGWLAAATVNGAPRQPTVSCPMHFRSQRGARRLAVVYGAALRSASTQRCQGDAGRSSGAWAITCAT